MWPMERQALPEGISCHPKIHVKLVEMNNILEHLIFFLWLKKCSND